MSKSVQHSLSFPVGPSRDKSKSTKSERRLQILGRPRRLRPTFSMSEDNWNWVYENMETTGSTPEVACSIFASNPCIIKISINKETLAALDRTRNKIEGNATYPDLIRIAVARFLENGHTHTVERVESEKSSRKKQRCKYLKVLFTPDVLERIGHQGHQADEANGLCRDLGMTRQQVINMAIAEYLKEIG